MEGVGAGDLPGEVVALPREFVVFDTETTGMPPGARLVEIGGLKVRGQHVVDRFERLIHPGTSIPAAVTRIHGIDDAMVARADPADVVLPEFLAWAGKAALIGHNVQFDASMLGAEAARCGLSLPQNPTYCTLRASRRLLKRRSHSLESLVRELDLPQAEHHRALADAQHTLDLMQRLEMMFGDEFNTATLGRGKELSAFEPEAVELPPGREFLRQAADEEEVVQLTYRLRHGGVFQTLVSPRFFYRSGRHIWMEALCHDRRILKSYRLDRILAGRPAADCPP